MKTKQFLLLFVLISIISCTTNTEDKEQKEPLNYQVMEYSKKIQDTLYYTIDYQYPFFKSENEELSGQLNKLNERVKYFLDLAEHTFWGVDAKGAIKIIQESEASGKYELMNRYDILDSSNRLISLKFETYSYALGAHGFTAINTYNLDLTTGKLLALSDVADLSDEGKLKKFNALLVTNFKDASDCFSEEPNVDSKYDKFAISPGYLHVYFEAYELGPYACGAAEIIIPIKNLKEAGIWKI